jgi:pyruvate-formate lyase-activating enzyme
MDAPPKVPGHGSGSLEELLGEAFPRMLMVQTTSACNSACRFCPHQLFRRRLPQGEMDPRLFERLMTEASHHPELACINLFLMNEPLMDPQLVERIHLAGERNPQAQVSLWTNGVALDPPLCRRLLDSPLKSLGISLHAHRAETYHRITGRRDFHRILRSVVHLVEQRNARRPDMTLVLRYVAAEAMMAPGEREELVRFWSEGNVIIDIDDGFLGRAGNLPAPGAPTQPRRWLAGCSALGGPKQAHILFSGQVVLCCMDYSRKTSLGDCSRQSLQSIWAGVARRRHLETLHGRRAAEPDFLCSRCELGVPRDRDTAARDDRDDPDQLPEDPIWAAV